MSEYTPGPWVAVHSGTGDARVESRNEWRNKDGSPFHATIVQRTSWDDALLIAAAPDLLEALRELLAQAEGPAMIYGNGIGSSGVKDGLSHQEFNALTSKRLAAARAALAKAAGA